MREKEKGIIRSDICDVGNKDLNGTMETRVSSTCHIWEDGEIYYSGREIPWTNVHALREIMHGVTGTLSAYSLGHEP